jgi:hypothetical protein
MISKSKSIPQGLGTSIAVAAALAAGLLLPIPAALPSGTWELERWLPLPLDKIAHFALFFVAVRPWLRSVVALDIRMPEVVTVLAATLYAGILELAQSAFTVTRMGDALDLVAGSLGSLVGVLLAARSR